MTTKNKDTDRLSEEIDIPETKVNAFQAQQARIDEAQRDLLESNQQKSARKRFEENKTKEKVKKIFNNAKKKITRTKLKKLQDQVGNHIIMGTLPTIPNTLPTSKPTMQLSNDINRTVSEDEDGYLVPCKAQPQIYTVILPSQEIENHKSMDSDLWTLSSKTLGKEIDEVHPNIVLLSEKETEAKIVEDVKISNTTNSRGVFENTSKSFGQHNNFKLTQDLYGKDRKQYYKQEINSINSLDSAVLVESQQFKKTKSLKDIEDGSLSSQLKQTKYKSVLSPSSYVNDMFSNEHHQNSSIELPKLLHSSLSDTNSSLNDCINQLRCANTSDVYNLSYTLSNKTKQLSIDELKNTLEQMQTSPNINIVLPMLIRVQQDYVNEVAEIYQQTIEQRKQNPSEQAKNQEEVVAAYFTQEYDKLKIINSFRSLKTDSITNTSLASSVNIFGSNEDLSWDNTGDIGVGYRYGPEHSCPTPDDRLSSKLIDMSNKNTKNVKGLEEGVTIYDSIDSVADPLKSNDVSFEEINEALKQLSAAISETVINSSESKVQEDPEDILDGSILQAMLNSNNDQSIESLSLGSEEEQGQEETEASIQNAGDKKLLPVPASSNESTLLLSDCKKMNIYH
ncbi:hypothetical protein [Rickettsia prowazekii]|nr:hypothetical protein MA1_00075 [Rickettsia prowazekii str. BuV67-CWPP]